jgi:hypothetical protein
MQIGEMDIELLEWLQNYLKIIPRNWIKCEIILLVSTKRTCKEDIISLLCPLKIHHLV